MQDESWHGLTVSRADEGGLAFLKKLRLDFLSKEEFFQTGLLFSEQNLLHPEVDRLEQDAIRRENRSQGKSEQTRQAVAREKKEEKK